MVTSVAAPAAATTVVVSFSASIFGIDVVKKAAYRFLDRFVPDFRMEGDNIVCVLTLLEVVDGDAIQQITNDFRAEVLDQDLRRVVAEETSGIRNTILALAFSPTDLTERE